MSFRRVLLVALLGLAACTASAEDPTAPSDGADEQDVTKAVSTKALVKGNNAFAADLYGELATGDDNLFFSPYSISSALAMTYAGAKSDTAGAMRGTLHLPTGNVHAAFKALDAELAKRNKIEGDRKGDGFQLSIANSLWGEKSQHFESAFLSTTKTNYGAGLELADFKHQPDAERVRINGWVEDKTNDKIKDLLPAGILKTDTKLVLVDAIYFKASWDKAFEPANTKKAKFTALDGKKTDVDMMSQRSRMKYVGTEDVDAVALPYLGGDVELLAIAPKTGKLRSFDANDIESIYGKLSVEEVNLKLPKFKIDGASVKLKDTLTKMGMGVAFSDDANFSGMTGKDELKISDVVHKAFVGLDEKGTEAAAATAVIMVGKTAVFPKQVYDVTFDRPFVFAIRDVPTGQILFMGRITKP